METNKGDGLLGELMKEKIILESKKQLIKEFEYMRDMAELKALSSVSLERPLTDTEFQRFKKLGEKYLK